MTARVNYVPAENTEVNGVQSEFITLLQKLAPDLSEEMARRAMILERIDAMQPVGRRQLAQHLNLPEREIRSTASLLKDLGYIEMTASGMTIHEKARDILESARDFSRAISGLNEMENRISELLDIERVVIVPGDTDKDPLVLEDIGRAAGVRLKNALQNGDTLAVTGGTTIAAVARHLSGSNNPLNIMVVPARGGLGRSVETQANTLASEIAAKIGAHHRLIHLPDRLDDAAMQEMMKLPDVREAMELLERADIILHGIGNAETTMKNRKLPRNLQMELADKNAVGESFGSYFDISGQCLLKSSSIGIDLAKLSPKCRMIAVAAGGRKAEAIVSIMRHYHHTVLVTDEGAAERIIRLLD